VKAHAAIPDALNLAASELGCDISFSWLATNHLERNVTEKLDGHQGIWCVPGSPYTSLDGALNAIRFARERGCPFLGTCGGFQHALIEYARNVLALTNADHAESNPATPVPFIARLACSLSGSEGTVHLTPASRTFSIYGAGETTERYNCNFGLNSGYQSLLDSGPMRVVGVDGAGEVRIVELDNHPFYIATLFQPELAVCGGVAHPLIKAFVREAAKGGKVHLPTESNTRMSSGIDSER
jgi:CTP synthase (UTP-ammonia lyase)